MRYAVFTTINGNSPLGKTLYSKISFRALKQCGHDQKGSLNSKKQFYSTCGFSKTFTRNLLDASNRLPLFYQIKRFSALPQERTHLMNLEIVKTPSIFQSLNRIVNYLIIKTIDKDFDMSEFVESSKTALVVVANLLSELKFSELDGLLTSECILEVEKNVRAMSPEKRRGLVVDIDDIYFSFPHYTKIIKGGNNGEKTYFQVTVVYHVCRNFRSIIAKHPWERIAQAKLEMFTTYNCRYIKEFISGVDSHWIMNGINVYKMEEDPIYQKNA